MRAAAFTQFGGPDVLRVIEIEDPEAGPGEVRVRVRAAGVQPVDGRVRRGELPPWADERFPMVVGNECAGVVDQVGEGVTGFAAGDEVIGYRILGCYAELAAIPAGQLVHKPAAMPWEVAGALSASGQTAHTLVEAIDPRPGETVLVHAAAGGVGTMAVQLARLRGATVIGTASEANHDHLRGLRAIPVAYGNGVVERVRALAPAVHAAIDAAGGPALDASLQLVADPKRVITIVEHERALALGASVARPARSPERLAELARLWEEGSLRVHVSEVFPLERAADAHRVSESRHVRGKLVLRVS